MFEKKIIPDNLKSAQYVLYGAINIAKRKKKNKNKKKIQKKIENK